MIVIRISVVVVPYNVGGAFICFTDFHLKHTFCEADFELFSQRLKESGKLIGLRLFTIFL